MCFQPVSWAAQVVGTICLYARSLLFHKLLTGPQPYQEGHPMGLTRREFFRVGTVSGAGAMLLGFDARPVLAQARELKIARTTETRSTCPYCSVSCGVIIHTLGDKAKNVTQ